MLNPIMYAVRVFPVNAVRNCGVLTEIFLRASIPNIAFSILTFENWHQFQVVKVINEKAMSH